MKENIQFTVDWFYRQRVRRCTSVLPERGLPCDTFISAVDDECQHAARKMAASGAIRVENGIVYSTPIFKNNVFMKSDDISTFLGRLCDILQDKVEDYQAKPSYTPQQKLERIREWREELRCIKLEEQERFFLPQIDELISKLNITIFGKEDVDIINRLHDPLYLLHYRHFGEQSERDLVQFHQNEGEYICDTILHISETVALPSVVKETVLELIGDYLDLAPLKTWEKSVTVTKKWIKLLEARSAEGYELGYAYLKLSERVLMLFKNPDNIKRSFEYMDIADSYFKSYSKEEEEKKLWVVGNDNN